jgi:hypothetical protein
VYPVRDVKNASSLFPNQSQNVLQARRRRTGTKSTKKINRMENNVITKDNEMVKYFFLSLEKMLDGIEHIVDNYKPSLGGERYLSDKEISERLKVSRRTLQDYRTEGKIPNTCSTFAISRIIELSKTLA